MPRGGATRGRGGRGRGRGGSAAASRRAASGIDDDDDDELDDDIGDADFKPKHVSKKRGGGGAGSVTGRARDKTRKSAPRLINGSANDERELAAQLKHLGLYAANTLGDGSCLFRSLSDQMHGTPNHHLSIRTEVCNFLLAHRDEFIAFINDENHSSPEAAFASHVAEMRMTATYGTQVEIVAFARLFKRRVKVIQAGLVYVIGFEDESPSERERRAKRRDSKGKMKDEGDDLPDLYIVYHNWEHYSSARNIHGPHAGLPCIIDVKQPIASQADAPSADDLVPTQEESLVLSSIRFPHRHTVPEIRKLIQDSGGSWETALDILVENEVDETESEDFNNISPSSHAQSLPLPVPTIGVTSATPGSFPIISQHDLQKSSDSSHPSIARYSSASTTSSTATSATLHSASTSLTRLSDLISETASNPTSSTNGFDKIIPPPAPSSVASGSSRIRSRANSIDHPDITAAESPRQRFRISREAVTGDDSSAAGDDPTAHDGSSVVSTSTSGSSSASHTGEPEGASADARAKESVLVERLPPEPPAKPRRGRPPKNRDGLKPIIIKVPTRRQRKQILKAGGSPAVGSRTRSKAGANGKEEPALQREFKELYV